MNSMQMVACPAACDNGHVVVGVDYVTRDMALDACDPALEGEPIPVLGPCLVCGGDGWILVPENGEPFVEPVSPESVSRRGPRSIGAHTS